VGRLEGQVAFISGVARGQGRSRALRLAEEGADIIGFDICGPIDTVPYPLASVDDLNETVERVQARGRRIVARQADVRNHAAAQAVFDEGLSSLGRVDMILANAGALFGSGLDGLTEHSAHRQRLLRPDVCRAAERQLAERHASGDG
jgi:NAD(P)-dependent dehydrogenase (short-subunit alcohol dehydrogenase family)